MMEEISRGRSPELRQHVAVSSLTERDVVLAQQEKEQSWWADAPSMHSIQDIENALSEGRAVAVPDSGVGYMLSPGVKHEFKVLEPQR